MTELYHRDRIVRHAPIMTEKISEYPDNFHRHFQ